MSCGHCQLKIRAEIEANGFSVIDIDMSQNTVLVDADINQTSKLKRILDSINYVVDEQQPILDIKEFTIWHNKLDDEENYNSFYEFLEKEKIPIKGFNDENFGLKIVCTNKQFDLCRNFINQLN